MSNFNPKQKKLMKFIAVFFVFIPFTIPQTTFDIFQDIEQGFAIRRLCPEFVEECPTKRVEVIFNRTTGSEVGNVFLGNLTIEKPRLMWGFTDDESLYTMTMSYVEENAENFTLDAYTHWLVTNIPKNDIHEGDTIFEFTQPTLHNIETHYMHVVLIFKQKDRIDVQIHQNPNETITEADRWSIHMKNFTKKYDLGNPEFGSWFYTLRPQDYDEYLLYAHPDVLSYFPTRSTPPDQLPPFSFLRFGIN